MELHAAAPQGRNQFLVQCDGVLALASDMKRDIAQDDLLVGLRQGLPELQVSDHVEPGPHMRGQAYVVRHLVELERVDNGKGILLGLQPSAAQCLMQFKDEQGHGLGSQFPEGLFENPSFRNADGQARQPVHVQNGNVRGRDMPESIFEQSSGHQKQALGFKFGAQQVSQRAIHGPVDFVVVAKGEGQALHVHHGGKRTKNAAHQGVELNLAMDDRVDDIQMRFLQPAVVRHDFDIDTAIGLYAYAVPQRRQERVHMTGFRLIVKLPSLPNPRIRHCLDSRLFVFIVRPCPRLV
ncbi:hypothetical protein D3C85_1146570 [compost metagenome]